jgi:hypothetical protein
MIHVSKGSKQRPTDKSKFDTNWEKIFGKGKKERLRESDSDKHREGDLSLEGGSTDLEEGSVFDAEHSIQHNATSENHR